ncbi:MAG TPA: hypothetical protein DCS07_16790 [Bdellovibrionales bacterium]|nr:MAG: hypothetical protein A2Z97_06640 [Bdellovibrionales bacterium GWB1_52_6]OFZ05513.1 MAG: hypothetical protein A2X97_11605 [Bdellovibrionales bacterium GWA1_52_35]OFZ42185.1 MAG: hypothetical protein A2070_00555 [Bdellovibrionales bacterium GWC1_52_8]HAR44262.1 hypothetical protein [Bdellovibrionales bacterium]HCM39121.1 hypothetical protein [Bdellovibrionales bacterium]
MAASSIVLANLFFCILMELLRAQSTRNTGSTVLLLGAANLVLGVVLFISSALPKNKAGTHIRVLDWRGIILWAAGYSTTYLLFLLNPEFFMVVHLTVAAAFAPLLAAFADRKFGGRERQQTVKRNSKTETLLPLSLLLGIVISITWSTWPTIMNAPAVALGGSLIMVMTMTASQMGLRRCAQAGVASPSIGRAALINGLALLAVGSLKSGTPTSPGIPGLFLIPFALALAIFGIQKLILFGIRNSSRTASALALSTAVPLSVLLPGSGASGLTLLLALSYCLVVLWISRRASSSVTPE